MNCANLYLHANRPPSWPGGPGYFHSGVCASSMAVWNPVWDRNHPRICWGRSGRGRARPKRTWLEAAINQLYFTYIRYRYLYHIIFILEFFLFCDLVTLCYLLLLLHRAWFPHASNVRQGFWLGRSPGIKKIGVSIARHLKYLYLSNKRCPHKTVKIKRKLIELCECYLHSHPPAQIALSMVALPIPETGYCLTR